MFHLNYHVEHFERSQRSADRYFQWGNTIFGAKWEFSRQPSVDDRLSSARQKYEWNMRCRTARYSRRQRTGQSTSIVIHGFAEPGQCRSDSQVAVANTERDRRLDR